MMKSAKQTPLGVNVQGSLLQNTGFTINPVAASFMGSSKVNTSYTPGTVVKNTCLNLLTYAINDAYVRGNIPTTPAGSSIYDSLISIGSTVAPALGNAKPPSYTTTDPASEWSDAGYPATTGYGNDVNPDTPNNNIGQGQEASWLPYDTTNPNKSITQWGFVRNYALQAWNEFNWNGSPIASGMPEYKDFTASIMSAQSYIDLTNVSINAMAGSQTFLKGTYSNMNDLTSADVTGVTLATAIFGQDCVIAGKVIDLKKLDKFGLPSVLLQTIKKYNALTQSLSLALLSAGLTPTEVDEIARNQVENVSKTQEQQIYGAFLIIMSSDLQDILVPLNCKTKGLETLADLLNVRKLFPNSYAALTVPVYNTTAGPTNSKTYYPIFENNGVSSRLTNPAIAEQIGSSIPAGEPLIATPVTGTTVQAGSNIIENAAQFINSTGA